MRKSAIKRPLWIQHYGEYDILVYVLPETKKKTYKVGNMDFPTMSEAKAFIDGMHRCLDQRSGAKWEEQVRQSFRELAQDIVNMVDENARNKYAFKEEFLEQVSIDVEAMVKLMEKARDEDPEHRYLGALKVKEGEGQNG